MTFEEIQKLIDKVSKKIEQNKEIEIKEQLLLEELKDKFNCNNISEGKDLIEEYEEELEQLKKSLKEEYEKLLKMMKENQWI